MLDGRRGAAARGGPFRARDDKPKPAQPPEAPAHVETQHRLSLNGHQLDYRAIAETIALHDKKGAVTASVFTISYVADVPPGQQRPVAFVFNGGPGAASVFLHLGALGPRILETPGDGSLSDPPYKDDRQSEPPGSPSRTSSSSILSAPGSPR